MALFETTGLLEIDYNPRARRAVSALDVGMVDYLASPIARLRKLFTFRPEPRPQPVRLAKLSDHLLEDIGLTRAEAMELDLRNKG